MNAVQMWRVKISHIVAMQKRCDFVLPLTLNNFVKVTKRAWSNLAYGQVYREPKNGGRGGGESVGGASCACLPRILQ